MMNDRSPENQAFRTPVTFYLIVCMLLATLPALSFPKVDKLFNPSSPPPYPWQFITGSFIHGWAFLPPLIHLAANLALFYLVGPRVERLLGSARYLILMLSAILAAGLVRLIPTLGPPGASGFILACGPVILFRWMAIRNNPEFPYINRFWMGLLVLGLMVAVPFTYGLWLARQGSIPLLSFFYANATHLTAFLTGGCAVLLWKDRLLKSPTDHTLQAGPLDRSATVLAGLIPAAMIVLIFLGALKKI